MCFSVVSDRGNDLLLVTEAFLKVVCTDAQNTQLLTEPQDFEETAK